MAQTAGTNLTADNNVPVQVVERQVPMLATAGQQYYRGQTVAFSSGLAIPVPANSFGGAGTDNSALRIAGQVVECPSGVAVATDVIVVRSGVLGFKLQSADTPVQGTCGSLVYAVSDNEICLTATLNPKAGLLLFIENGIGYVQCNPQTPA